jgi:hypothetical protein
VQALQAKRSNTGVQTNACQMSGYANVRRLQLVTYRQPTLQWVIFDRRARSLLTSAYPLIAARRIAVMEGLGQKEKPQRTSIL